MANQIIALIHRECQINSLPLQLSNSNAISFENVEKAKALYEQSSPYFTRDGYLTALDFVNKALKYNPKYARAYHGLAILYLYHMRDYPKAKDAILQALALDGGDVEMLYTAGRTFYALGDYEGSKPFFQKYVRLAPDTYNTRDLQKNYRHLLGEQKKLSIERSSRDFLLFYLKKYHLPLVAILLLFLLVLIIWQRKASQKKEDEERLDNGLVG